MFPYGPLNVGHQAEAHPTSDQYGLAAAIAYEVLTGRALFQGHSEQIMRQLRYNNAACTASNTLRTTSITRAPAMLSCEHS